MASFLHEQEESSQLRRGVSATSGNSDPTPAVLASDPGYGRSKRAYANGKPYTEDRSGQIIYIRNDQVWRVMWVGDGHGGDQVVRYVAPRFGVYFKEMTDARINPFTDQPAMAVVLQDLFARLHAELEANRASFPTSGCTFCACVVNTKTNMAYIANLGDSVCQVIRGDVQVFRTVDHDASSPAEQERIRNAFVSHNPHIRTDRLFYLDKGTPRFYTGLMVTGGFGDFQHDVVPGCIRRVPDIYTLGLKEDDVIVLSTDGLFEKFGSLGLGPGRDETEIARDISTFMTAQAAPIGLSLTPPQAQPISLSQHLIDSHVQSIVAQLQAVPAYTRMRPEQLHRTVLASKDNCDIITHRIQRVGTCASPSLKRYQSA